MNGNQSERRKSAASRRILGRLVGWAILASAAGPGFVKAQAPTPTIYEEQGQLVRGSRKVESLTSSLFGDQVSLYNGGVSFVQTDVTLPGNNSLAVSVGRRLSTGSKRQSAGAFGDWELEIPHIKGVFSYYDGWNVGPYYGAPDRFKRCSQFDAPADAPTQTGQAIVSNFEFWFGNHLNVPGSGEQELLRRDGANPFPSDGNSYPVVTKGGWAFRCTTSLANGGAGEGFIGVAPDGTQYRFDWMVSRAYASYSAPGSQDSRPSGSASSLTRAKTLPVENVGMGFQLLRKEFWLLPTSVTDRFGNTVTYTYSASNPWRLQTIVASDGRSLTLGYDATSDLVRTVSDGTRTWTYNYNGSTGSSARLVSVVQPDNAQWQFGGDDLQVNPTYLPGGAPSSCGSLGAFANIARTKTMVHPSGATATFTLTQILRGRSYVYDTCADVSGSPVNTIPFTYLQYALTQKTLSGPGLSLATWNYAWDAHNGSVSPCSGCPDTVTMRVTDPNGVVTQYTHGNRWQETEGQLLKVEEGWNGQSALRVKETRYRQAPGGLYPTTAGTPISWRGDGAMGSKFLPVDRTLITQQGVQFIWEATSFDNWAKPTVVSKSSTLGYQRTETTAYVHNLSKWALGLLGSVTVSGGGLAQPVVTEAITYDPVQAWPTSRSVNGRLDQTYDFYGDGTLKWVRDGAGQQTTYSNYSRGLAQSIAHPGGASESVVVGNYGQVLSHTNAAGTTTQYGYDAMGRLSGITYPPESWGAYYSTSIAFERIDWPEYGIPAGHWRQTETTGNARTSRYFDALWRVGLTHTRDLANEAGTSSFITNRYDIDGRKTFESQPQRSISSIGDSVPGTTWWFDPLGRQIAQRQDSELGPLDTVSVYDANFIRRTTNPRGLVTSTGFQVFDTPTEDAPVAINAPESVNVAISRDALGKALSITRAGGGKSVTRSYVYDGYQRLCKTIEPETGATVQSYDLAGNVAWRASGLSLPSAACDQASVLDASKVSFGYDARNRLTSTTFADGSQNYSRTYTPDGKLQQVVAFGGGVNTISWNYGYNNRRLLVSEGYGWASDPNWSGWVFNWGIDANGNVASLTDPWGPMSYAPNALGQPTQVSGYASQVSYHPNGAIAGYSLDNGVTHTVSLNARGLPVVWRHAGVSQDRYAYDGNGNVVSITDEQEGINTRSMPVYDGLDRLRQANGPWGAGQFEYDAIDNLVASTVGGRSLTHSYDASNKLSGISGSQSMSFGYDPNGNITSRGGDGFVFDIGNRMRNATGKANYAYDGYGRRNLVWWTNGDYTHQAYTQDMKLRFAWRQSEGHRRHVYLGDKLIAEMTEGGVKHFFHTDALGSPIAKTNASGGLVHRSRFEPYGGTVSGSTNPTPIGFTGHVNDVDTGLVYMQQRYYDPIAGRFLSVDPVTTDAKTGGHFNRYQYGENNPYKFKDPDGRQSTEANNGSYQAPLAPLYQMLKATFGGLVNERPGTAPVNGVSTERTLAVHALEVTHSSSVTGSSLFVGVRSSPGFALQSSVVGERTVGDTSGLTVKVSASAGLGSGLTGSASASTGDGTNSGGLQVSGGLVGDAGKATFGIRPPAVTVGWTVKLSNDAKPATQ